MLIRKDPLNEVIQLRRKQFALRRVTLNLVKDVVITVAAVLLLFTQVFGLMVQRGNDMYPAIRDGDIVMYYRNADLVMTDAVVYEYDDELRTGRIAGRSGTVISETGDKQLTFDGIYMPESKERGIWDKTYASQGEVLPLTIAADSFFILNDDRERENDSRMYGEINKTRIRGRIIAVLRRRSI